MKPPLLSCCAVILLLLGGCSPDASLPQAGGPIDWVALDGGCFRMGEDRAYPEERPAHRTCVNAFAISKTEITNAQFATFVSDTGYVTRAERGWSAADPNGPGLDLAPASAVFRPGKTDPKRALEWWSLVEGASWRHPDGIGSEAKPDWPVVHITRSDAEHFAQWADARLATEAEWEFAARGGLDGALLSWTQAEDAERDRMANIWQGLFPLIDEGHDGHIGVAPVASYPANPFGLHDMIGNVWEWTATPYRPDHTSRHRTSSSSEDPAQPDAAVGTIKGGSFLCATSYCLRFRPAARQAQDLAFGTSHIGFRIVRDRT